MSEDVKQTPRWVRNAARALKADPEQLLARIDELLYDGWQPAAVRPELGIPYEQKSSLEKYANQKYRHRRILAPAARLREVLVGGAESMAGDCAKLFRLVLEQGLSPGAEPSQKRKTAKLIIDFVRNADRIAERVEETERRREREPQERERQDPKAALGEMLADLRRESGIDDADG